MKTLIVLFLSCLPCFASFTNVVGLEVETNGWVLRVTIGGDATGSFGTNGNLFNGFGTNNSLSSTTATTLNLTRMGFDDSGNGVQVGKKIYLTHLLRLPYPSANYAAAYTNDFAAQDSAGTNVVARVALSDYVFLSDSNLTLTTRGGWISGTNGNSTNLASISARTVTNSSQCTYIRAVANWTRPGLQRITGNTMRLGAVGFHISAQQGRPLRVMRFVAQDQHGNAVTNFQTGMTVDYSFGDYLPFGEYVADMNISTFTNGDLCRCDFTAYPWEGDTNNAVLDTFNNEYAQPTPLPCAITNVCDRLGKYGVTVCVVDVVNGTANGVATTNFNPAAPPATFSNMGQALAAIIKTNVIVYNRSNAGAAFIYLTNGSHLWGAASQPAGNKPDCFLTICPFPGVAQVSVAITNKNSFGMMSDTDYISNVVVATSASSVFDHNRWSCHTVFDSCVMSNSSISTILDLTNLYYMRCDVQVSAQGITPLHVGNDPVLVRGNFFRDIEKTGRPRTVVGNIKLTNQLDLGCWSADWTSASDKPPEYVIIYNNVWLGSSNTASGTFLVGWTTPNLTNGAAIIQNVWEETKFNAAGSPMLGFTADGSTSTPARNLMIWYNTCLAGRQNMGYNDNGSTLRERRFWSVKNNNFDRWSIKDDRFNTPPPNGARIGNWPLENGVQCSGNIHAWVGTTPTSFIQDFIGLNSVDNYQETTNSYGYIGWSAYDLLNSANGPGGGNYRLQTTSHVIPYRQSEWLLPFDIEANARSLSDPPGAFASANARKGSFF